MPSSSASAIGLAPLPATRGARYAFAILVAGALAIALSPIFIRAVLGEVGPTAAGFWRTALAAPLVLLWLAMEPAPAGATRRPAGWADHLGLVAAAIFFTGDLIFWHLAIKYTTIANSTLLANFAPIWVALLSFLLFGERFSRTFLAGLAAAILGAAALMGDSLTVSTDHILGDGLGLVTGMFYACYILTVGRLRASFSTATIMAWTVIGTSLFILPVALLSGEPMLPGGMFGWSMLLGVAIVSQFGGQGLITYALAHLPASFSSVSLLIQPVAATCLAWVIFGEALGPLQALGGVVVLTGIMLARRGSRPTAAKPAA